MRGCEEEEEKRRIRRKNNKVKEIFSKQYSLKSIVSFPRLFVLFSLF